MGTPDRLALVERYLARREAARAARAQPKVPKVAFLDRDGTLNRHVGLISEPEQIEMLEGAAQAVARLCEAGWRCFIVTNQPVIARGLCTEQELEVINGWVVESIEAAGGSIEKVFYSPYHPETHHGDGVEKFRRGSDCRKPGSGMLFAAMEEFGLDLAECVMMGDTWRDVVAGRGAGVRTVLVGGGDEVLRDGAGEVVEADWCCGDLVEAVEFLLNEL